MSFGKQWLGEPPGGWEVVPAKALFRERREASREGDPHLTPSQQYGVLPQSQYMAITGNRVVLNLEGADKMRHVEPEDFVIHLRSFQGGIEHSAFRGKVSMAYTVLSPLPIIDPRFFRWTLKSDGYIRELAATTNQLRDGQSIKFQQFANVRLPLPPMTVQTAIADFLDRETARIDTLIEKQEKLIETLYERRRATITSAFDGLVPSLSLVPLRRFIRFLTSGSRGWGDYYTDTGERFVRIGNLPRNDLTLRGEVQYVSLPPEVTEGIRTKVRVDDLLFSITAYLGSVAVVDESWSGSYVNQHVALCRLSPEGFLPKFVGYYMLTARGQEQLQENAVGGTKSQLSLSDIRNLRVPFVDSLVQTRVVHRLDSDLKAINTLLTKAERFIELAKERRSALITAAVTGQIEVGEEAPVG